MENNMDLMFFLDQHSGSFTALATVALVIVTIVYTIINRSILKSNEKTSNEQVRPYIVAYIYSQDDYVFLEIKNTGRRPAHNLKISFEPTLEEMDLFIKSHVTTEMIPHEKLLNHEYFPPEFKISTILIASRDFVDNEKIPKLYKVTIKYVDFNNNKYDESYTLSLDNNIYSLKVMKTTKKYFIQNIKENIQEINKSLKTIADNK